MQLDVRLKVAEQMNIMRGGPCREGIVMEHRKRSMTAIVAKMRMAGLAPAFSTWKSLVHRGKIQQHVQEKLTLEERVEVQQQQVRRVQRVLNKAQASVLRKMRNAGYLGKGTEQCILFGAV